MKKKEKEELFAEYDLDWDDPFTEGLVYLVSNAVMKLFDGFKKNKLASNAFNDFVDAWEYYYIMPEKTQLNCKKLMDVCEEMWEDVYSTKVNEFCVCCVAAIQEGVPYAISFCGMCSDILEAIFALDGKLPEAQRIFDAAYAAARHGKSLPDACIAYLYVLSARLWFKCLGYPCAEEELLLSEGIIHHLEAKAQGNEPKTELYSMHMATAIFDASYVRLEKGIKLEEISELVREAYALLETIDSPAAFKEKMDLYELTGIPYPSLDKEDNPWMAQLSMHKNGGLLN